MSGSVFAAWTTRFVAHYRQRSLMLFSDKVVDATRELAEALRCNMSSSISIKEDLKRRSIEQFYDAVDAIVRSQEKLQHFHMQVWNVDGSF